MAVRSASGSSLVPLGFTTCNITLGNKVFQHDFVVCKHLMRPLILGREFLFKNELKVYYSKTGECRLDHKQEELIATIDSQNDLTLTLKSGVYIPGRTVAVLNVNSFVHRNDIGQFYSVRSNSLMEDEYPQLQIIPTLHKVDTVANTLVPFILINLGEDFVFLPKGQVVGFLDPEYIDVSEINLDIASVTINTQSIPSTIKEKIVTKNQDTVSSDFITSPADVAGPHKADLQDFEISEEEMKAFHDILIYSPDVNTHLYHLELVFQCLREVDLKLKMEKCSFLKKHIQYLGHIVSGDGLKPVPENCHPYNRCLTLILQRKLNNFGPCWLL